MRFNKVFTTILLSTSLLVNAQQNDSIQKSSTTTKTEVETKSVKTTSEPKTVVATPKKPVSKTPTTQKKAVAKKTDEKATQKLDSGTIDDQFEYLINKSNRYQDYKVVKQGWLNRLRKATNDSLNVIKKELSSNKLQLIEKENTIQSLTEKLNTSNNNIDVLNNEKSSISFFGSLISKSLYSQIVWSIIAILILALGFYIYKFNNSNIVTKETLAKFSELEKEYENHRHRSLEREQEVRRKLQDEINKTKA